MNAELLWINVLPAGYTAAARDGETVTVYRNLGGQWNAITDPLDGPQADRWHHHTLTAGVPVAEDLAGWLDTATRDMHVALRGCLCRPGIRCQQHTLP